MSCSRVRYSPRKLVAAGRRSLQESGVGHAKRNPNRQREVRWTPLSRSVSKIALHAEAGIGDTLARGRLNRDAGSARKRSWTVARSGFGHGILEGRQEIVSPETMLPEDDLVFFLLETIPDLDLSAFYKYYSTDGRGQPPFGVPMMVTLLVYAYSVGVPSSRKIAAACERNLAFLAIVGLDRPDFRTISEFRKHHLPAMRALFLEVLRWRAKRGW